MSGVIPPLLFYAYMAKIKEILSLPLHFVIKEEAVHVPYKSLGFETSRNHCRYFDSNCTLFCFHISSNLLSFLKLGDIKNCKFRHRFHFMSVES